MRIEPLDRSQLPAATVVLAGACAFDRAAEVADEKLFGAAPAGAPAAFGAWDGERLVGVAAVCGNRVRVLAVIPSARGRGAGSALLAACEEVARRAGHATLRTLDQAGNYLAPGIDERNVETIAWLERRGFARAGDARTNVLIDVRGNPRVTAARVAALTAAAAERGYEVRRARPDERALLDAVGAEFGGAWPFELARALGATFLASTSPASTSPAPTAPGATSPGATSPGATSSAPGTTAPGATSLGTTSPGASSAAGPLAAPIAGADLPGVHVALRDGAYCAFAAHDGNNRGLGWFGPTGTWPAHRGQGLGEVLLLACLVDVAQHHARCEVAWIGPRPFYDKVAGVVADRRFVVLAKPL